MLNPAPLLSLVKNKAVQIVSVGVLCAGIGFAVGYSNREEPKVVTKDVLIESLVVDQKAVEKAVEAAKAEWQKSVKERVVTKVVTLPSGQKTEETIRETDTQERSVAETKKTVEKEEQKVEVREKIVMKSVEITPYKPESKVGVEGHYSFSDKKVDMSVEAGRHLFSDIWMKGSYKIKSKEAGVGLEFHF